MTPELMGNLRNATVRALRAIYFLRLCWKYKEFTMASRKYLWRNLVVADAHRHIRGCVIECGVWRGGMSAALAEVMGKDRDYYLFDSFEGLPIATEKDGAQAKTYQTDTESPGYYDNCRAPIEFAERAMAMSGVPNYTIVKGWFEDSLLGFVPPCQIALLRLDGDWYESTLVVLEALFKHMAHNGIIVVDDYYAWDGCSRAVHDFLSTHSLTARISQKYGICVIEPRVS